MTAAVLLLALTAPSAPAPLLRGADWWVGAWDMAYIGQVYSLDLRWDGTCRVHDPAGVEEGTWTCEKGRLVLRTRVSADIEGVRVWEVGSPGRCDDGGWRRSNDFFNVRRRR